VLEQRVNQKVPSPKQWRPDDNQDDMKDEVWKYHGTGMMISNMGRVRFKKPHHFSWSPKRTPRPAAGMPYARINNKAVHRLVYEAFLGIIPSNCSVDHIDQDKTNNRLTNLRAITMSEQNRNRTFKPSYRRQTSLKKRVRARFADSDAEWEEFESLGVAVKSLNHRFGLKLRSGCASLVAQGKQRHHLSVVFEYVTR